MSDHKLIYIEWGDAIAHSGWRSLDDAIKWSREHNYFVEQVGWVIEENDKYICIASSRALPSDDEPQYSQLQKIPKTWIRKRKTIKL